jgi:hypothetical protein
VRELEHELVEALAQWRSEWARQLPADRADILNELEWHLRDGVAERLRDGVPLQAAFAQALESLGAPEVLLPEFAKTPPRVLAWWPVKLVWCVYAAASVAAVGFLAPRLTAGWTPGLLAAHMGFVSVGYLASICTGLLAVAFLSGRLWRDPLPGQKRALRLAARRLSTFAVAATAVGIGLGFLCPLEKHGWFLGLSTHEVGGFVILAWNLFLLASLRRVRAAENPERTMVLGLVASLVVLLGWYGARLVDSPHPEPGAAFALAILLAAHALMAATALVPANSLWSGRSPT